MAVCSPTVREAGAGAFAARTGTHTCTASPALTASTAGTCSATVTVTATDECGNNASVTYSTRIDGAAPTVTKTSIAACYPTVAAAEADRNSTRLTSSHVPTSPAVSSWTKETCIAPGTVTHTE